jgi:orotidine-5'-phosphate decarboxylase
MIRSGQLLRAGSCRSCRTPGSGTRVTHHNESVAGEVTGTADRTSTIGTMPMPVIVALDFPCRAEAMELVHSLGEESSSYKVGLQLLTEEGPGIVRDLVALGKSVFLDLKLHEIPNSVAGAVRAAGKLGVSMVTVHASAGSGVLRAAVAAAAPFPELKVLALTVITSLTDHDLPEIGLAPSVGQQVERLAMLAASCGCHGVVASAHEAASLASKLPHGMLIVTPGVQRPGARHDSGSGAQVRSNPHHRWPFHHTGGQPATGVQAGTGRHAGGEWGRTNRRMPLRQGTLPPGRRTGHRAHLLVPGLPAHLLQRHRECHLPGFSHGACRQSGRVHPHRRQRQPGAPPLLPILRLPSLRRLDRAPGADGGACRHDGQPVVREAVCQYLERQCPCVGLP